jgi:hypothetical protein
MDSICSSAFTAAPCDAVLEGKVIDVRTFSGRSAMPAWRRPSRCARPAPGTPPAAYRLEGLCPERALRRGLEGWLSDAPRAVQRCGGATTATTSSCCRRDVDSGPGGGRSARRSHGPERRRRAPGWTGRRPREGRAARTSRAASRSFPGSGCLGSGATAKPDRSTASTRTGISSIVDGVAHANQDWGLDHAPEIDPFAAGVAAASSRERPACATDPDALGGVVLDRAATRISDAPGVAGDLNLVGITNGWGGAGSRARCASTLPVADDALSLRARGDVPAAGSAVHPRVRARQHRAGGAGAPRRRAVAVVQRPFVEASYSHYANDYGVFSGRRLRRAPAVLRAAARAAGPERNRDVPLRLRDRAALRRPCDTMSLQARAADRGRASRLALQLTYAYQERRPPRVRSDAEGGPRSPAGHLPARHAHVRLGRDRNRQ